MGGSSGSGSHNAVANAEHAVETYIIDNQITAMTILFMVALLVIVIPSIITMYYILVKIDLASMTRQLGQFEIDYASENKLELQIESEGDMNAVPESPPKTIGQQRAASKIPTVRKLILLGTVMTITLLTYLLLVFPNGNMDNTGTIPLGWLTWIGLLAVCVITLRWQIADEIRRNRYDRLALLLTLVLLMACGMNLASYGNQKRREGYVYRGPARIVGYDYETYQQKASDTITRTDLEVAWGGTWGCPMSGPGYECQGFVSGAMCQSEEKTAGTDDKAAAAGDGKAGDSDGGGNRQRRTATTAQTTSKRSQQQHQRRQRHLEDGGANRADDNVEEELEQAEANEEALEEENEELETENTELNEEVTEEAEVVGELEDTVIYEEEVEEVEYEEIEEDEEEIIEEEEDDDAEYVYFYDDDVFEDSYWDEQDWESVWGDYACYDLFETDLEGETYDASVPPNAAGDEWPFIYIYGNCQTCEAYIVDYFSTEHFRSIENYKYAGRNYGIAAFFSLIVSVVLMTKYRYRSTMESEVGLMHTVPTSPEQAASKRRQRQAYVSSDLELSSMASSSSSTAGTMVNNNTSAPSQTNRHQQRVFERLYENDDDKVVTAPGVVSASGSGGSR